MDSGAYPSNFDYLFNEAFFNGTMNNNTQDILLGFNFSSIKKAVEDSANKVNANLTLTNPSVKVNQSDPWHVEVTLTVDLQLADSSGLVSWNKSADIKSSVPINTFEDPLYYVSTQGIVTNKITQSPYYTLVSGTDVSNLSLHAQNSYYVASTQAPSFLDRLKGINTPNIYGIESIVNLQKLSQQGVVAKNKTTVDYIYFSQNNPSHSGVLGMPSWFRLDTNHFNIYNVTGLTY